MFKFVKIKICNTVVYIITFMHVTVLLVRESLSNWVYEVKNIKYKQLDVV